MISYQRSSLLFTLGIISLTGLFSFPGNTSAADCVNAYTKDTAVPNGYGAAYNFFTPAKELLIKGANCESTSFSVTIGATNNQYAYKTSYYWNGATWAAFPLTGQATGDWVVGPATANVSSSPQSGVFVAAYVCSQINSTWKCGCHDEACASPSWQLQKVTPNSSGGGGGNAGVRGRVHVANGTVLTDKNTMLRGAAYAGSDDAYLKHLHDDLKLNVIRVDIKTVQMGKTVQEQLPALDKAVDAAGRNHMYVMMHYSTLAGSYQPVQAIRDFWIAAAPRYKDRTHVFYEMINEPVATWSGAKYDDTVLTDLKSVYDIMRAGAPDTHIVLYDFPSFYSNIGCDGYDAMFKKGTAGVDWTKASIGYHFYNPNVDFNAAGGLQCLRAKYPLIMTETSYWADAVPRPDAVKYSLRVQEQLGISWFSLDGKGGNATHLENEILPDLHSHGYDWPVDN